MLFEERMQKNLAVTTQYLDFDVDEVASNLKDFF